MMRQENRFYFGEICKALQFSSLLLIIEKSTLVEHHLCFQIENIFNAEIYIERY